MTAANLKNLMSVLLVATGVLHLVVALFGAPAALQGPLSVFGFLYAALGVWVRGSGRPAVLTAIAVTALGLVLGGSNYLEHGGPKTLPVMLLIDVIILAVGAMWVMKSGKAT
jgi:ABC-type enterochelin transport system permease subunit